jgi:hypothetical protein
MQTPIAGQIDARNFALNIRFDPLSAEFDGSEKATLEIGAL